MLASRADRSKQSRGSASLLVYPYNAEGIINSYLKPKPIYSHSVSKSSS